MNNLEKACSQMDYIIENSDNCLKNKIPDRVKNFFKSNKLSNYNVDLDTSKPLYEQDLLEETKIYVQIVYKLFIAPKSEKDKYIAESRKLFIEYNLNKMTNENNN